MSKNFIFSSESVGEGHPDKVCDTISDAILDACLAQDKSSRVACETYAKSNLVVVGGEITTRAKLDYNLIARQAIRDIGYTNDDDVFHADRVLILNAITQQSPDIAQGVDARRVAGKGTAEQGAGDQGLMFGYACNETPELMPAPIMYAHQLGRALTRLRKKGHVSWLRPDAKSQVSVEYVNDQPLRITNVVVSTQHAADVKISKLRAFILEEVIKKTLPKRLLDKKTEVLINPTGRFVVGGPQGDTGLTGRKIIVDTYGGMGRHGGGAFSGKDPSKVDRSAAYMGRYVAKNIVAAGIATSAEIQFAYAIGHPKPVSVCINTFGTAVRGITDTMIEKAVCRIFSFKPADIVRHLKLLRPIYTKTTNYGHFGKIDDLNSLTWEKTDRVKDLRRALRL
jgi:S-adenosylmethionine synthetase